ncbi:MAG: aldo/keto reductase [Acidimicrobiales bacterium]|jgi:aryl-alcohol dehydrogenase-like predicted oxidoreductase
MDMRRIGSLEVSVIGLGTNNFGFFMEEDAVPPVVDAALEAGINFFDTADSYLESEPRLAKALGGRRDQVVLATKFGSPVDGGTGGAAPGYVRTAVERSLGRLGTDRIDLYQLHRPDPETPIADTLGVLDELVREGKVIEIGCSNFSAAQLREAEAATRSGGAHFATVQNQWNLLHREDEADAVAECERLGIGYLPYYPLASGVLSGKYTRGEEAPPGTRLVHFGDRGGGALSDRNFDIVDAATKWAGERGHSVLELALAWLAAKPVVASVIAGATKPEQVRANVVAADWRLTPGEVAEIDALAPVGN